MPEKPSIPKGTRDFGPDKMLKRYYILQLIRSVFIKYGFLPLETPAMENLSVLTGKYGEEGDQLMFKILNSGNYLESVDIASENEIKKITPKISEKALRYDLTVPFARFVAMNRNELAFPFRRYQIQPVWRADRPQKGRYREFYQCDADIVGTTSLICEYELIHMATEVLTGLGLSDFTIKLNNRKILAGVAQIIGEPGKESLICTAIDKLDKIGEEGVEKELQEKGISALTFSRLHPFLHLSGTTAEKISKIQSMLTSSEIGLTGVKELSSVLAYLKDTPAMKYVDFDPSLARGLSYYTGAIIEVKANNVSIGSISGGGRYDNLTGMFGLEGVSGVGISFGVDRLYDVLEYLNLFPESGLQTTRALIIPLHESAEQQGIEILQTLRKHNIASEIYPEVAKMKKSLGYADQKNIPYTILIGEDEIQNNLLTCKNMVTGVQSKLTVENCIQTLLREI